MGKKDDDALGINNGINNSLNSDNNLKNDNILLINSKVKELINEKDSEGMEKVSSINGNSSLPIQLLSGSKLDRSRKYNMLLESLPFDENQELENVNKYKTEISPYDLMFECCLKGNPRNKAKYELIKKCKGITQKFMNIESIIHNQMEMIFLKSYLLNELDYQMFKYNFKSINISNVDYSMKYLKYLKKEDLKPITKDHLIEQIVNGNAKMMDIFYDYHVI